MCRGIEWRRSDSCFHPTGPARFPDRPAIRPVSVLVHPTDQEKLKHGLTVSVLWRSSPIPEQQTDGTLHKSSVANLCRAPVLSSGLPSHAICPRHQAQWVAREGVLRSWDFPLMSQAGIATAERIAWHWFRQETPGPCPASPLRPAQATSQGPCLQTACIPLSGRHPCNARPGRGLQRQRTGCCH